jgi:hypothetical protein
MSRSKCLILLLYQFFALIQQQKRHFDRSNISLYHLIQHLIQNGAKSLILLLYHPVLYQSANSGRVGGFYPPRLSLYHFDLYGVATLIQRRSFSSPPFPIF